MGYVVRDGIKFDESMLFDEKPIIDTICSSCYSGRTTCSSVIWHQRFYKEGKTVNVCSAKAQCAERKINKGGEYLWFFEWHEEEIFCWN